MIRVYRQRWWRGAPLLVAELPAWTMRCVRSKPERNISLLHLLIQRPCVPSHEFRPSDREIIIPLVRPELPSRRGHHDAVSRDHGTILIVRVRVPDVEPNRPRAIQIIPAATRGHVEHRRFAARDVPLSVPADPIFRLDEPSKARKLAVSTHQRRHWAGRQERVRHWRRSTLARYLGLQNSYSECDLVHDVQQRWALRDSSNLSKGRDVRVPVIATVRILSGSCDRHDHRAEVERHFPHAAASGLDEEELMAQYRDSDDAMKIGVLRGAAVPC